VDTSKRLDDDSGSAKVTRLQCCVLAAAALSVVFIPHHDPGEVLGLVVPGGVGDRALSTRQHVLDSVGLAVRNVDGTDEHVVGDVVQVPAVLEPGPGHGDVIRCALTLDLSGTRELQYIREEGWMVLLDEQLPACQSTLIRMAASRMSSPFQALKGLSSCRRVLLGSTWQAGERDVSIERRRGC